MEHIEGKASFGEFLKLVDQGKIPVGSILLVESFDRLSREAITEALGAILEIRSAKESRSYALSDQRLYTKETINSDMGQTYYKHNYYVPCLHEESLNKFLQACT